MNDKPKCPKSKVLEAIPGTGGILTRIAKRLGVTRKTLADYRKRWPEVESAIQSELESGIDFAEIKLMELINSGDIKAIIYYLDHKGRGRGWGSKLDVKVSGDNEAPIVSCNQIDLTNFSSGQLSVLERALSQINNNNEGKEEN